MLYSIDAIEEEMQVAMIYYLSLGMENVGIRRGQLDMPKRMEATVQTSISAS